MIVLDRGEGEGENEDDEEGASDEGESPSLGDFPVCLGVYLFSSFIGTEASWLNFFSSWI